MAQETLLPPHGRIACAICHSGREYDFDRTVTREGDWRITNNPLAWGAQEPRIIVLGFSKGPTQAGALGATPHNAIAYKGSRTALAKILYHIDLIDTPDARIVDLLIASREGDFHFGSLVRCAVERLDTKTGEWAGTGGGMLDRFVKAGFGQRVVSNCAAHFLASLPEKTRLIVMLGLGSQMNYIRECRRVFESVRPGVWQTVNDVAYTDGKITVVHTEHFASQGALLPNWLSGREHARGALGLMARDTVYAALGLQQTIAQPQSNSPLGLVKSAVKKPLIEPRSTPALNTTQSGSGHPPAALVELTQGNVNNGHVYLRGVERLIPVDGIGGKNASNPGRPFTVHFAGETFETDVAGNKMILRKRLGMIFRRIGATAGDKVEIAMIGPREWTMRLERSRT